MILKLKRTPGIYLVGFMGSGKSTVGRMLADQIGWRFADVDDDVEAAAQAPITEVFMQRGEEEFRRLECEAIRQRVRRIQAGHPMVLALGGGAFTQQSNIDLLENNGVTIWLDADFPVVKKRVSMANHRPLARNAERFAELFQERRENYAKAEYRIAITEDDSRAALQEILRLPIFEK
jgi:shikimate kinase